jgi:hypothetical protein
MGKSKEAKSVNKNLSDEYSYQQGRRDQVDPYWNPRITDSQDRSAESRSSLESSLGGFSDYANSLSGSADDVDTSAMSGDANTYRNYAQGNTETGKFFRNLMNTGGYSEGELGDIRQAGTRIIPSFFSNLRNQMRTAQNATGGYSPGYSSSAAAMSRDAAHMSQDAALDTELGISDRVRQGKLTGAGTLNEMFMGGMGGASDLEKAIAQVNLQNESLDLQAQGLKGNMLGNVAQGYGSLYGQDMQNQMNNEAMKMKAQGMSDESIERNLIMRGERSPNKGFNWSKAAKIAAAAAATYFTGGAAAPLLIGAIGSDGGGGGGGGSMGPRLWGNSTPTPNWAPAGLGEG